MNNYIVKWEIDIEAETPEDAAKQALYIHRDPQSIATYFNVIDEECNHTSVDLDQL